MFARLSVVGVLGAITAILSACSGFTASHECDPGDSSPCTAQCGQGTMHCQPDGSWGICQPDLDPQCMPGDYGECDLSPGEPPGLWFCSDDCRVGPCMSLCIPDETHECEAQCGPGSSRCLNDGSWEFCREYFIPPCRPGDIRRCDDGVNHQRCTEDCYWGPCEDGPCNTGEVLECGHCASQVCLADHSWSECAADPEARCSPDQVEDCEAPCGPGTRRCTDRCEWTECWEIEPVSCHPGDSRICATTLYCGTAFRVCTADCEWSDCIETGD